jgi:hypothetical protein
MPDDREPPGRAAYEAYWGWLTEHEGPESHLPPPAADWDGLNDVARELYMRMGSAVAVRAIADAGLELSELRAEVARYRAALPACLGALRARLAVSPHGSDAKPYREALMALRGSEDQERTDEKGPDRA